MAKSEVAQFKQQQLLRDQAAQQGINGFAAFASHQAITARMEIGAKRILRLIHEGKHEEALLLMSTDEWC